MASQVGDQRLDHHPLRRRDRTELLQFVLTQGAGVGVGEEPRLVENQLGHGRQVINGGGVPVLFEPVGGQGVA